MNIATWNVNSLNVRLPHVSAWLEDTQTDVLALQEIKMVDEKFPHQTLEALGYHSVCHGQKTYNGVALIAREPLTDVVRNIPGFDDPQARVIAATVAGTRVICVYVPNGQALDSDKYAYKLRWLAALRDWLEDECATHDKVIVLGDFNIAPEPRDTHDPDQWEGGILCSDAERNALHAITALGLTDSFRQFDQPDGLYSWWDYRAASFRRDRGLRIDLILTSQALQPRLRAVEIDRAPRGWERPSDHTPVVATLA